MKKLFAGAMAAMALVACGKQGSGSMTGSVAGNTLTVADGILYPSKPLNPGALIELTNKSGWCETVQTGAMKKNTAALQIRLNSFGSQGSPIAPTVGEYPVSLDGGHEKDAGVLLALTKTDSCEFEINDAKMAATSGKVTLTSLDDSGAKGTYEATFENGDKVSGEFDVPACTGTETATKTCN